MTDPTPAEQRAADVLARVLHDEDCCDNPGHADWTDCTTSGPCRRMADRYARVVLDAAGVLAGGVLDAVEALAEELEYTERRYPAAVVTCGSVARKIRALVGQQRGRDGGA